LFYNIALFLHVMATIAMFAVIGIVMVNVARMRQAQTGEQLRERTNVAFRADKLMPVMLVLVLVPAIYMVFASWGWTTAWINTALIALVLASPLGPAVNTCRLEALAKAAEGASSGPLPSALLTQRDDQVLWASCCTFTGILIGIVFLMTVKPGLVGSLATIVVALGLGLIMSIIPGKIPTIRKSFSL
jgi:hypothetical protein